jgi:uncharacterized protein YabN with tetrapyrrole methylase and pyrophosphatase domain
LSTPDHDQARRGSLTVVGAGIRPGLHTTQEARVRIEHADKVLYLLAEQAPTAWIERLNSTAESLGSLYRPGVEHGAVYEDLVTSMLTHVRRGLDVCMVTYGNPAVLDQSGHEAVSRARSEGFRARILPGISALDCLFVDLQLDPGTNGLQSFDATAFLVFGKVPDTSVPLVLWQISVIGEKQTGAIVNRAGLAILAERLVELYGADHEATVYEASPFPVGRPLMERCSLRALPDAGVTGLSSLYVPPASEPVPDHAMQARLRQLGS